MSPQIVDDMVEDTRSSAVDGIAYGLGTGIGRNTMGPIGHMAGGIAAGSYVDDKTLTTLAIGEGVRMMINQGRASASQSGSRRRM